MKNIDAFINQYKLTKTLQFSLLPVGKTEENFDKKLLLEEDEQRAKDYEKVKGYMDRYHRFFIDDVLSEVVLDNLTEYAELYYKTNKTDSEKKSCKELEAGFRKVISQSLKKDARYKVLFSKEIIREYLPRFLEKEEEKNIVASFYDFTTYFKGFFTNRENMYTDEEQSTAIAYRCINDNLPKFLDNAKVFNIVKERLNPNDLKTLNQDFEALFGCTVEDMFCVDYFCMVLTQSGIESYNEIIGGYTTTDGTKVKGLNEYINAHNQVSGRENRIPKFKILYKQILSDRSTISFVPDKFDSDNEVLQAVNSFYCEFEGEQKCIRTTVEEIVNMFDNLADFDASGIYVTNAAAITDISNCVFGSWSVIQDGWNAEYNIKNEKKTIKNYEKYDENRRKAYKKTESFSISELQRLAEIALPDTKEQIVSVYSDKVCLAAKSISEKYNAAAVLLSQNYEQENRLYKNETAIDLLKGFLESIKELQWLVKTFLGTGKEESKDELFYGEFLLKYDNLKRIDRLYDKVRNYMTQRPYSKEKIKLNFENAQFLGGWDVNKEKDYRCGLMEKEGCYYLAVMDKFNNAVLSCDKALKDMKDCYRKIEYKLLPGPNKMLPKVFFSAKNIDYYAPSDEIMRIYKNETFIKGENFSLSDCHTLIDFYKASLNEHPEWKYYNFIFKSTNEYKDIGQFYNDIRKQGYKISFRQISSEYINEKIDSGELYLFQIYNKDFSQYSKGTPNLHTLYFKMLFDERNLRDVVYQLNGSAEMFYRKASIKESDRVIHPANEPIKNKNPHSEHSESTFNFDLIKDERFTKRQFSLHMPITLNFKSDGISNINEQVRKMLRISDDQFIIGIDRGERNLIYICVINGNGEIVEQHSLNEIVNEYNGVSHTTDYQALLDRKEKERLEGRISWKTVEGIKELKEGYISQVVHKICQLVVKYDAVIAMENLNSGFKNSRIKVEKQVYQKFEKMLIDKLNYYADKSKNPEDNGGLLRAYQLTNKFVSFKEMDLQNGFIFYIPAWLTSKIDPTTGFTDLLHPHYTSLQNAVEWLARFKSISYKADEDMFAFEFDYYDFPKGSVDYRNSWTLYTFGDRIKVFRNVEKNSSYDYEKVSLTAEFKKLFKNYSVDYTAQDLQDKLLSVNNTEFYKRLLGLFGLVLQMRNSNKNTGEDYLISPVKNRSGGFFDSRNYNAESGFPCDADANGAYNIARKALWAINVLRETPEDMLLKAKLSVSNKEWLAFAQQEQ